MNKFFSILKRIYKSLGVLLFFSYILLFFGVFILGTSIFGYSKHSDVFLKPQEFDKINVLVDSLNSTKLFSSGDNHFIGYSNDLNKYNTHIVSFPPFSSKRIGSFIKKLKGNGSYMFVWLRPGADEAFYASNVVDVLQNDPDDFWIVLLLVGVALSGILLLKAFKKE